MYSHLLANLRAWGCNSIAKNGVEEVLHLPQHGDRAYLHTIFPPLEPENIEEMANYFGEYFHPSIRAFLEVTNGFDIFRGRLSVFGFQHNLDRDPDRPEPFDLRSPARPYSDNSKFRFSVPVASYGSDGSILWLDGISGHVLRRNRKTLAPMGPGWPSLEIALTAEYERIAAHFGSDGTQLSSC